jgi:hypothetical protein
LGFRGIELKHLHETFTDDEFAEMKRIKKRRGINWHDLIIESIDANEAEYGWQWDENRREEKTDEAS